MTCNMCRGQSLIEVVVAVGIIIVVLAGVSDLVVRSLGLSSFQVNKVEAERIAKNQLDAARANRDLNSAAFFADQSPVVCVGTYDTVKYGCTISYGVPSAGGIEMSVRVVWHDGDKTINTERSQFLANPSI